jgi:hypothetical protein
MLGARRAALGGLLILVVGACASPPVVRGSAGRDESLGAETPVVISLSAASRADRDLSDRLAQCAGVFFRGHTRASSAKERERLGRMFTATLGAALATARKQDVQEGYALGLQAALAAERVEPRPERWVAGRTAACFAYLEKHRARPPLRDGGRGRDGAFVPEARKTTPVDVLAAQGRPASEDYDADGSFEYAYCAARRLEAYEFGVDGRLIRVRSSSDRAKGRCGG